jgi:hypothetical protein
MRNDAVPVFTRFRWSALKGRCRRLLAGGSLILAVSAGYAAFAGSQTVPRGAGRSTFDRPVVALAERLNPPPVHLRFYEPQNDRELYLAAVIKDERDLNLALTIFLLRMIVAATAGGIGLVLTTAGSTEWEIRSEQAGPSPAAPA